MHIGIIAPGYPSPGNTKYTFIEQIAAAFCGHGAKCTVISPESIFHRLKANNETHRTDIVAGGSIEVYQPYAMSMSNLKLFGLNSHRFSRAAVKKVFSRLEDKPNILYGHFWRAGVTASQIGQKYGIPAFVATGESVINVLNTYKYEAIKRDLEYISGVIAVSTENKEQSIELGLAGEGDFIILPNAVDPDRFFKMDKNEVRDELGFDREAFIVISVGAFSTRKGTKILSQALDMSEDVHSIFIGDGPEAPSCRNILFSGKVTHDMVAKYLNCADVFVLPTLAEGSCNAIIEAMACGLPIVSSDRKFNYDTLNNENSLMVDPTNANEISSAINKLKNDSALRERLGSKSLETAAGLKIENRAYKILEFIAGRLDANH